jgi:hypothetical protein
MMEAAAAREDLMAVQQLGSLILSDEERAELKSLTMRRKTAQALALRAKAGGIGEVLPVELLRTARRAVASSQSPFQTRQPV